MPVLKVNNITVGLTDNLRDVGDNRLPIIVEGKTYYARLGDTKTSLVVRRISNGNKSYVQTSPIFFNTWKWQKYPYDIRGTEKMFVYLPKGRYRATARGGYDKTNEFTISTSQDIEVNVSTSGREDYLTDTVFNINGWRDKVSLTRHLFTIKIERIGE